MSQRLLLTEISPDHLWSLDRGCFRTSTGNPILGGCTIVLHTFLVITLLLSIAAQSVFALQNRKSETVSSNQVKEAIRDGVNYLKRVQNSDGTWMVWSQQEELGITALATFALLNAGVDPEAPVIQKAVKVLKKMDLNSAGTYTISFQTMVLCLENPKENLGAIQENVEWFEKTQWNEGGKNRDGGWGYNRGNNTADRPDNSISQVALLALHEAQIAGANVKPDTWIRAKRYWESQQRLTGVGAGGFGYETPRAELRGSMTAAGVSSLIIASENALTLSDILNEGKVQCCGKSNDDEYRVDLAIKWLARGFRVDSHPIERNGVRIGPPNELYYLYSLERAGRLAGRRFFGSHDWYRMGAKHLVHTRQGKDYWSYFHDGRKRDVQVVQNTIGTSFALLFLAKGLRPVVVSKYQHGTGNDWDYHKKGVHFLTRETEKAWNRKLNWQNVDGRRASVNDLLESPVLFISGRNSFQLTKEQQENLREYINQGGFIFAEACTGDGCDPGNFEEEFKSTMQKLFNSKFELLGATHPIWNAQKKLLPHPERPVFGLQACCRTAIVYCPRNLSCFWQLYQPRFQSKLTGDNRTNSDFCMSLGLNVLTYATNRELRDRLDRPKIDTEIVSDVSPDLIDLGKISHGGGSDDAAVALQNLARIARREASMPFSLKKTMVTVTDKKIYQYPILFMHGRKAFSFSEDERKAIRKMVEEDGFFIFADSICASESFAESFRQEMKLIFPDKTLKRLESKHEIFSQKFGSDLSSVTLRTPILDANLPPDAKKYNEVKILPVLEGISIQFRGDTDKQKKESLAVVFSPNDLSCGLENAKSVECKGYQTDDAARIGINILKYALNRTVPD